MHRPEPQTRRGSSRRGPGSILEPGLSRAGGWVAQRQALHDAANWLTVLLGHVEALGDTDEPDRRQWHLELARRAARAAHRLCALPPGSGRISGEIEARAHCERLVAHVRPAAQQSGVRIDLEAPMAARVVADGPGFDDSILNLLRNGVEGAGEGGQVILRMESVGPGWTRFAVQDTGPGIPLELRARIGEVGASTRPGVDRGLGLARVQEWLAGYGTELEVGEAEGGGALVSFRLPVARDPEPTVSARGLKVMVIEDDPAVAEVLGLLLEVDGHAVTQRADCGGAVERFAPGDFDLVLCDQHLPDGQGAELLARLAAEDSALACFLVTGDPQSVQWDPQRIRGVLAKPVTRADLRAAVAAVQSPGPHADPASSQPARPEDAS